LYCINFLIDFSIQEMSKFTCCMLKTLSNLRLICVGLGVPLGRLVKGVLCKFLKSINE
jgi:hypothetical protein